MTLFVRSWLAVGLAAAFGCSSPPPPPADVVANFFKLRVDMPAAEVRVLLGRPLGEAPWRDVAKIDVPKDKQINLLNAGIAWHICSPPGFEGRNNSAARVERCRKWIYSDAGYFSIGLTFLDDKLIDAMGTLNMAAMPKQERQPPTRTNRGSATTGATSRQP